MCFSDVTPKWHQKLIPDKIAAFYRLLRGMALSSKILSPTCAPAHGDITPYFFFEKIFRSDGGMCVSMTGVFFMPKKVFRRKSHIFADNSVRWHLATNSFHQHVRLLMEILPHTFFFEKLASLRLAARRPPRFSSSKGEKR